MFQKKKKYEGRNEGAHMWAAVQSRRKTHLHHQGLLLRPVSWSSVGTYGFPLQSPTTVSTGSCPPSQHIASRLACNMRPCVLIEKAW